MWNSKLLSPREACGTVELEKWCLVPISNKTTIVKVCSLAKGVFISGFSWSTQIGAISKYSTVLGLKSYLPDAEQTHLLSLVGPSPNISEHLAVTACPTANRRQLRLGCESRRFPQETLSTSAVFLLSWRISIDSNLLQSCVCIFLLWPVLFSVAVKHNRIGQLSGFVLRIIECIGDLGRQVDQNVPRLDFQHPRPLTSESFDILLLQNHTT